MFLIYSGKQGIYYGVLLLLSLFLIVVLLIKDGRRKILEFKNVDDELEAGRFYFIDGVMIYLESTEVNRKDSNLKSSMINRKDGRTRTIFENGTVSNMYYRSVSKAIYNQKQTICYYKIGCYFASKTAKRL